MKHDGAVVQQRLQDAKRHNYSMNVVMQKYNI